MSAGAKFEVVADAFHSHLAASHFSHLLSAAESINEFVLRTQKQIRLMPLCKGRK